jgi:hypothetical protein
MTRYFIKGTLKIPDGSTPIIYIGPGTGVAPMRSILASRIAKGARGDMVFFGARNRDAGGQVSVDHCFLERSGYEGVCSASDNGECKRCLESLGRGEGSCFTFRVNLR